MMRDRYLEVISDCAGLQQLERLNHNIPVLNTKLCVTSPPRDDLTMTCEPEKVM